MADFDNFEGANTAEEDPAAEFLAREQTELAGLEDDNFAGDSSAQPGGGDFDAFGSQATEPAAQEEEDDDVDDEFATNGPSDAYSAISQVDTERAEPEQIKLWREEQKNRLEKKDVEEEQKKGDWHDVARKELEDWYKHHAEQLEKAKENNRAAETAFIKERDESIPGAQWEKICRLCEFNPKNVKSTKDVSRMRSMLLQLKQTPLVR
ncbi:clathrin light chain A-like isoform X3 [Haliotis rufescens]|uniref:clathrin light chain A-like isoform X3 n=1 Tax=Haliotis rufescens TaxID=6454 RepID=UPI001EAFB58E|nr:clathrin light chain A-like isoform X3 [Haliotis rufescens]